MQHINEAAAGRVRALLIIPLAACLLSVPARAVQIYTRDTVKPMAQVLEDAEFAITDHNFRVVGRLHVGKAIRESGDPHFPNYEIILFCNVTYARRMLELDPDIINYCPARVAVRQARDKVVITAPLFPGHSDNPALDSIINEVNGIIRQIVNFAGEPWLPERTRKVQERER